MRKLTMLLCKWVWVVLCLGAGTTSLNHAHALELPIVVLICSYNNERWVTQNLDSVFCQQYENYRILYIDDCSDDDTVAHVQSYKDLHDHYDKLTLIANTTRSRKMKNMYNGVHSCQDHEIIVQLDGDDWFCDDELLARINHIYQTHDVWLTYGSYIDVPGDIPGYAKETDPRIIIEQSYRNEPWLYMPTRTFYAWLFKKIELKDFIAEQVKHYQGLFLPSADDPAFMFPMLEMAGHRFKYIDRVSYVANRDNPIIGRTLEPNLQGACACDVRHKKPYNTLRDPYVPSVKNSTTLDMLIVSDDNPPGLARLLDSIEEHTTGIERIAVVCNADDSGLAAYTPILAEYSPLFDIQLFTCNQLEECLDYLQNTYVLIAQDAVRLVTNIHLPDYLEALERTGAYGVYFAYSAQTTPFYNNHNEQIFIPSQHVYQDLYAWKFNCCSFALFNNYDMTILRKTDLAHRLLTFNQRNFISTICSLQQAWQQDSALDKHQVGLFLEHPTVQGRITSITTPVSIPSCINPRTGRGYRTPADVERKRKRKERLAKKRQGKSEQSSNK